MSKEKQKTIIFTVILAIILVVLVVAFITNNFKKVEGTKESREILETFNEYFNSKERKVIYYASSDCSYCKLQTPILETIAKDYDMDYYYIDSSKLGETQRDEILEKLEIAHKTPTTVIVENGEIIDTIIGYTDGFDYVEFFKEAELLPSDAVYSSEKNLTYINYSEYEELISSGLHIIVIGQTSCSHCIAIKPALSTVAGDYNLTINYINLTKLSDEEASKLSDSLKTIEYNDPDFLEDGSFGTPLTLIVENGKVKRYISGERSISQLIREFKKAGLISE